MVISQPMQKLRSILPKKNIKVIYYLKGLIREYVPRTFLNRQLKKILNAGLDEDFDAVEHRLNYYNKLSADERLNNNAPELKTYRFPTKGSAYHFDFVEYARYFKQHLKSNLFKGDITHVPDFPTIVKSRPIKGDNRNSVLLNLNKVRHFVFVNDVTPYDEKKDMLVWRGSSGEDALNHRKLFLKMYFDHPMCEIGNANPPPYVDEHTKQKIAISEHLKYKFILCLEGVDVATNLKWVMSSNSIAVMPKPKYETWFMEGTLIPNHHFIEIKDDYSDLEERIKYFLKHPAEAKKIIKNAHAHVEQFQSKRKEKLISLLVMEKYFVQTVQMQQISRVKYASDIQ